jgi:hypothetical protein
VEASNSLSNQDPVVMQEVMLRPTAAPAAATAAATYQEVQQVMLTLIQQQGRKQLLWHSKTLQPGGVAATVLAQVQAPPPSEQGKLSWQQGHG